MKKAMQKKALDIEQWISRRRLHHQWFGSEDERARFPRPPKGSDERNLQALSPSYSPPSTMSNFLALPSAARYCSRPLKSPRVAWNIARSRYGTQEIVVCFSRQPSTRDARGGGPGVRKRVEKALMPCRYTRPSAGPQTSCLELFSLGSIFAIFRHKFAMYSTSSGT